VAFTIERMPGENILLLTVINPLDPVEDPRHAAELIDEMIEGTEGITCIVEDLRELKLNFSDLTIAMSEVTRKRPGSARDPRIQIAMVGSGWLVEIASSASRQAQYGGLDIPLFTSVEEAVEYCRERLSSQAI
jgi:hypothetical protein